MPDTTLLTFLENNWDKIGTILAAIAACWISYWSYRKNLKLSQENLELQQKLLQLDRQRQTKELREEQRKQASQKSAKERTYKEYLIQTHRTLNFQGLNAILQRELTF